MYMSKSESIIIEYAYINRLLLATYGVGLFNVSFKNGDWSDLRRSNVVVYD